jgi:hypothetical protein
MEQSTLILIVAANALLMAFAMTLIVRYDDKKTWKKYDNIVSKSKKHLVKNN